MFLKQKCPGNDDMPDGEHCQIGRKIVGPHFAQIQVTVAAVISQFEVPCEQFALAAAGTLSREATPE